jgi:hypothetical protein
MGTSIEKLITSSSGLVWLPWAAKTKIDDRQEQL